MPPGRNPSRRCPTIRNGGKKEMINVPTWTGWKNWKKGPYQGVVKRDWFPTGRIDFATQLDGDPGDNEQPSEFKLLIEEHRVVESIAGSENLEIQWRFATLREAKTVVSRYHKYLSEHSLIKSLTLVEATTEDSSTTQGKSSDSV
jgi:hypothetical protein